MNSEILAKLREILAKLYSDEFSIRRIVDDSRIKSPQIVLSSNPTNTWHSVLTEADKLGRIDDLLRIVEDEYGTNNWAFAYLFSILIERNYRI